MLLNLNQNINTQSWTDSSVYFFSFFIMLMETTCLSQVIFFFSQVVSNEHYYCLRYSSAQIAAILLIIRWTRYSVWLCLWKKKKTLYEIVVRGLLAKRMSGFMELQFEFLRETKRSVSLEGWIDLWHCLSSCNLWVLSEMSLQEELVL